MDSTVLQGQEKLDSEYPELDMSPLVRELRKRAGSMPKINIDMSWLELAACKEYEAQVFFPDNGAGVKKAKIICAGCSVRHECLEYALLNNISHGVWGGASERQRVMLQRERRETLEREENYEKEEQHSLSLVH